MLVPLLMACGGPGATPETEAPAPATAVPKPSAPLKTYGLNQLVTVPGWDLAIQKVDRIGTRLAWSQFSNTVPAAGIWFVIVVDMKNTGAQPRAVTADDFSLQANGNTYPMAEPNQMAAYGAARGGRRLGDPIAPGTSVSFYTVYDLPPDATNLLFTFKQETQPIFAVGNATR